MTVLEAALTDEQAAFMEAVDGLAARHVAPRAEAIDHDAAIPDDLRALLLANELHSIDGPVEHGGSGGDLATALMMQQRLARASGAVGAVLAGSHVYGAACRCAEDPSWERVERIAEGSWPAVVEGGDAPIRAVADGDGYTIDGEGAAADVAHAATLLVVAETPEDEAIVLEVAAEIASIGPARQRTGLRGVDRRQVAFHAARAAPEDYVGGATAAAAATAWATLADAAVAIGVAEAALAEAVAYVGERRQFGRPISDFAGIRAMVADMDAETRAAAATLHGVASRPDALTPAAAASVARAAVLAGRAAVAVSIAAVQLHGGYGYIVEFPVERLMRDAISARARCGGRGLGEAIASDVLGSRGARA